MINSFLLRFCALCGVNPPVYGFYSVFDKKGIGFGKMYAPLAEFAGAGASVPLLGFGHLLAKGVRTAVAEKGAIGILTGGLTAASAGITASLVCGVVCSLVGKSHDQN